MLRAAVCRNVGPPWANQIVWSRCKIPTISNIASYVTVRSSPLAWDRSCSTTLPGGLPSNNPAPPGTQQSLVWTGTYRGRTFCPPYSAWLPLLSRTCCQWRVNQAPETATGGTGVRSSLGQLRTAQLSDCFLFAWTSFKLCRGNCSPYGAVQHTCKASGQPSLSATGRRACARPWTLLVNTAVGCMRAR